MQNMKSWKEIWATSWGNLSLEVYNQVKLQPACSATEVFYYLGSKQQRNWSDCAYVQVSLLFV